MQDRKDFVSLTYKCVYFISAIRGNLYIQRKKNHALSIDYETLPKYFNKYLLFNTVNKIP